MNTLAVARNVGSNALNFGSNLGSNALALGGRVRESALELGGDALGLARKRPRLVFGVIAGVAALAVGGVILARVLRKRAEALSAIDADSIDGADIDHPKAVPARPGTLKAKHGGGSGRTVAKAAKL